MDQSLIVILEVVSGSNIDLYFGKNSNTFKNNRTYKHIVYHTPYIRIYIYNIYTLYEKLKQHYGQTEEYLKKKILFFF